MTRTILAAAAAFLAATTLMADQARACISCEYTPEVVRESLTSRAVVKPRVSARAVAAQRRAARPRFARASKPIARAPQVVRAAPVKAPQVARAVPVKTPAAKAKEITTGSVDKAAASSAGETTATNETTTAPASTSTVLMSRETRTATVATVEPVKSLGCKKFLPAVGVTVDCE